MKTSQLYLKLAACGLVAFFAFFLLYNTISSSDFPRGLYGPPILKSSGYSPSYYDSLDSLQPSLIWNYPGTCQNSYQLLDYLEQLDRVGLKSILRQVRSDSLLFLVEHYSCAQYKKLQVEWDSTYADSLLRKEGTGYYFFDQYHGECPEGNYWYIDHDSVLERTKVLHGPHETATGAEYTYEPLYNWPLGYNYQAIGRTFRSRVRAMMDTSGLNVNLNDTVFTMEMIYKFSSGTPFRSYFLDVKVGDFDANLQFDEFYLDGALSTSDTDFCAIFYKFYAYGKADLWFDWVEYMDMEQAYPLFWDSTSQASTLRQIALQCSTLEASSYGSLIAGWAQSDEPLRSCFTAHGIVNNYIALQGYKTPQCPVNPWWTHNYKHFVNVGKPRVLDQNYYVFEYGNSVGDQNELTSLACSLEVAFQAANSNSIPLHFTGQVHSWCKGNVWDLRDPKRSEILAETYMALAHGAKGITFWKYKSDGNALGDSSFGLVDFSFAHPANAPHLIAEKWQAVHDVFAQLDSLGNTLLSLERDTAYCAKDGGFVSPVTSIYFEENDTDYIEVGQFKDPQDNDYLIVVNRRTDAARHITVETNKTSTWALRDLYTQEQFVSSTGDFKGIPFEAGQGRVFALVEFEDWSWDSTDRIIIADEVTETTNWYVMINPGCEVYATEYGSMLFT